jgi:hypothetical protein
MVRQPIPELIRLYKQDKNLFSIVGSVYTISPEKVPFSHYYITHLSSGIVIVIKEIAKCFADGDIFSTKCEVSYSITCSSFKLSELEVELLSNTFQSYLTIWQENIDSMSEDNKSRNKLNKLLNVEDTYCKIHTTGSKESLLNKLKFWRK